MKKWSQTTSFVSMASCCCMSSNHTAILPALFLNLTKMIFQIVDRDILLNESR